MTEVHATQDTLRPAARLDQVDLLRGCAALLVVFHHAWGATDMVAWPVLKTTLGSIALSRVFDYTYVGVDLFFVLSGFCLAWPYLSDTSRPFAWRRYARRRFWRIYPPYFFVFVALLIIGYVFHRVDEASHIEVARLTVVQLSLGLTLQKTYLNGAFWTLCMELRWYCVFPFAMLIAKRFSALPLLLLTATVSYLTHSGQTALGKVLVYLPVFVSGIWAAEILAYPSVPLHQWLRRISLPAFLCMLAVACRVMPGATDAGRVAYPEAFTAGGIFFFLVVYVTHSREAVPTWLEWLRHVGISSYTLYLIHGPCLELIDSVIPTHRWSPVEKAAFWFAAAVPCTVFTAVAFYHILEKPFLNTFFSRKHTSLIVAQHAAT